GATCVERRAAGDERGASFIGRGTRDEQGGAAVNKRGVDNRQPGAEGQDRRAPTLQHQLSKSTQLDRYRHDLSRPRLTCQAVFTSRSSTFQSHFERYRTSAF